jgi:hypothetical protein
MTEIPSEADIHCPAEKIFDVIIDFCPARRLPGAGVEFQAVAGGADQLSPVAVRQPPGGERAGPGPARGVPAELVRAAAAAPAADRVDPDVERVHGSP